MDTLKSLWGSAKDTAADARRAAADAADATGTCSDTAAVRLILSA